MRPQEAFADQARACDALGSPMYAALLRRIIDDLDAGGVTTSVLAGHEDDPGPSALSLRLLGSVHRLVLERRAGELAAYYPSVGGTWDDDAGSRAFLRVLEEQPAAVREWLDRAPQTNEVGRSTALMGGLLHLSRRTPVRLFEIGSSAGLNLLADRFAYVDTSGTSYGATGSLVRLDPAWDGTLDPWPDLDVVERHGCDLYPVDPRTTQGRLALTAYVWSDQSARLERLRGALQLAAETTHQVEATSARDFVDGIRLVPGTTTVLWHSIMWQYLPTDEQEHVSARLDELGVTTTGDAGLAHLFLEPVRRTPGKRHEVLVVLTEWHDGEQVRRVLGQAPPHGVPVTWDAPPG